MALVNAKKRNETLTFGPLRVSKVWPHGKCGGAQRRGHSARAGKQGAGCTEGGVCRGRGAQRAGRLGAQGAEP